MTTRALVGLASALEAATGVVLVSTPKLVSHFLLGADLSGAGIAVGRVGGFALFSLAISCWPHAKGVKLHAIWVLFVYNLLAALYLAYLRASGEFDGHLLWPVAAVHGFLAVSLALSAYHNGARSNAV
jgi:hypothetical protein